KQGWLDVGARYAGGSARSEGTRNVGAIARSWRRFDRIVLSGSAEYEAEDTFDQQNGLLSLEATPFGGPRGPGRPRSPTVRFRWRPWIGVDVGDVFTSNDDPSAPEHDVFGRAHAKLELHYAVGPIEALRGDTRQSPASFDVEATGWLLFDDDAHSEGFVKAAL